MNRRIFASMFVTIATFVAILAMVQCASLSAQESEDRVALNLPGATTSIEPPAGFEPIQASDEELARFGYPPRPDSDRAPRAYAAWQRAVTASGVRVVPELEVTDTVAGSNRAVPEQAAGSQPKSSYNWSGAVVTSGATTYNSASTFYYVAADYVVPAARQEYGICDGGWDREMTWVGIDGWGSADVVKAGTESDGFCNKTGTATRYYAWFAWYPNATTTIKNFPIHPGDDIFVEVWHTSPTSADVYMVDYQANQHVSFGFTAPKGVSLIGNSAEWVIERPLVNGKLATISTYVSEYFSICAAVTENHAEYHPNSKSSFLLDMVDTDSNTLSYPTLLGADAIWLVSQISAE